MPLSGGASSSAMKSRKALPDQPQSSSSCAGLLGAAQRRDHLLLAAFGLVDQDQSRRHLLLRRQADRAAAASGPRCRGQVRPALSARRRPTATLLRLLGGRRCAARQSGSRLPKRSAVRPTPGAAVGVPGAVTRASAVGSGRGRDDQIHARRRGRTNPRPRRRRSAPRRRRSRAALPVAAAAAAAAMAARRRSRRVILGSRVVCRFAGRGIETLPDPCRFWRSRRLEWAATIAAGAVVVPCAAMTS